MRILLLALGAALTPCVLQSQVPPDLAAVERMAAAQFARQVPAGAAFDSTGRGELSHRAENHVDQLTSALGGIPRSSRASEMRCAGTTPMSCRIQRPLVRIRTTSITADFARVVVQVSQPSRSLRQPIHSWDTTFEFRRRDGHWVLETQYLSRIT